MPEAFTELLRRYADASKALEPARPDNYERDRIFRLREDIDAFRRDLKYMQDGGTIILSPDFAEIDSYLQPKSLLGHYCFPIEDRATFDFDYAKSQKKEGTVFVRENETRKIGRRVLRARAHLFRSRFPNLLLPPYLEELDVALSLILAGDGFEDLTAVFEMIVSAIRQLGTKSAGVLEKLNNWANLSSAEQSQLLETMFAQIVSNPLIFSNDMTLGKRDFRINKLARANDFLNNSNSYGIEDYDWNHVLGRENDHVAGRLRNLTPDATVRTYIENLFYKLPRTSRTNLSIYADAQALSYLAAINGLLDEVRPRKIKVQLVSWALSPVAVARALWPEQQQAGHRHSGVEVRHPKLLAAAINFDEVSRNQVEADLERFSEALNLYELESGSVRTEDQISNVRRAWGQLDDTLLAWAIPIGSMEERQGDESDQSEASDNTTKITEMVAENRDLFVKHLVREIDKLSKNLSDTHWTVVQPENIGDVKADYLFYEPNHCIILRPRVDHARCAIAIYSPELVELIHRSFENEILFGTTLVELAKFRSTFDENVSSSASVRAERQLLRGFLFAIRDNSALSMRYCQVARAELARSQNESGIRSEIQYLSHYACRELGTESRRAEEFSRSLRLLEQSQLSSAPFTDRLAETLKSRYFVSWITTFRQIAVSEVSNININNRWRKAGSDAYDGCLRLLNLDLSKVESLYRRLEGYHVARASQNVMLAFLFHKLNIGTWRQLFSDFLEPAEDDARHAWRIMGSMRESREAWQLQPNMIRNDFAYLAGTCMFADSEEFREQSRTKLVALKPAFESDPAMQRVLSMFLRHSR